MSLFKSLFPLARDNSLTVLIVAEGEYLRVNVTPKSKGDQGEKTLYPLSLLATPEELDRDFAEAVEIYSPGSQSVLEQAHAASEANSSGDVKPALPAPAKGRPGRKPKAAALPAPTGNPGEPPNGDDKGTETSAAPEVDPRQHAIPGLDDAEPETPVEETPAPGSAADEGIDLL